MHPTTTVAERTDCKPGAAAASLLPQGASLPQNGVKPKKKHIERTRVSLNDRVEHLDLALPKEP